MAKDTTPKREDGENKQAPATAFESLTGLRDEMNHLFDEFFSGFDRRTSGMLRGYEPGRLFAGRRGQMVPAVDVSEDESAIKLTAELPGMKEEDVEVVLRDDMLTVRGEKKSGREENKENFHLSERQYGSFERAFRLPETADADSIEASIADGILTVTVPKRAEAKKAEKKIKIGK